MKTDEAPSEIIEIIDDDADVFGDRGRATTLHDTGGPRWVGPAAATALTLLIGFGVVTSGTSNPLPKAAPAPTTTFPAPTTTVPTPTTTPRPQVPYYAADPPREFVVAGAELGRFSRRRPATSYQLWATEGSTGISGSWFSIETSPVFGGGADVYLADAYRAQIGQSSVAISHTRSGATVAQFTPDIGKQATIRSKGVSDDDVVRLAESLTANGPSPRFDDGSPIAGYRMISTTEPWLAVQGKPIERVAYVDNRDPSREIQIVVGPRLPPSDGGATLDRDIALRFLIDERTTFTVGGHVAAAGSVVEQPEYALATWLASDHIVTMAAQMPVSELIDIAQTVHEVGPDEWEGMRFQATRRNANSTGEYHESQAIPVSFGTDADALPWKITSSVATFDQTKSLLWQWDGGGFSSSTADLPRIDTVVQAQRTYVVAALPRPVAAAATLVVARAGLDPVSVAFTDAGTDFDGTLAAYAFSEPVVYTAQILGPDGTVLAQWPQQ